MGTTTYAERARMARSTAPHSREVPRRDMWSNDPDRTTRNDDTRTSEQVTADTFPVCRKCGVPLVRSYGGWGHAPSIGVNVRHRAIPLA